MKAGLVLSAAAVLLLAVSPRGQSVLKPVAVNKIQSPPDKAFAPPDSGRWKLHRETRQGKSYRAKGEALVVYRNAPGASKIAGVIRSRKITPLSELISFDEDKEGFEAACQRISRGRDVLRVEPNLRLVGQLYSPTKAEFARSQDFSHVQGNRFGFGKRKGKKVKAIRVGILDSGIDYNHPDLKDGIAKGVNLIYEKAGVKVPGDEASDSTEMDYNGHGTMVAGLIGARINGFGIDGLNGDATMVGIKAFSKDGSGTLADVIAGVQWAMDHGIDLLNMSFGSYEYSATLEEAIKKAAAGGMVLVASAGNDFAGEAMYPARYQPVVSVGGLDPQGNISDFSNWGDQVSIYAPAEDLMSTGLSSTFDSYVKFAGTSAAAAFVSGALSLAMQEGLAGDKAKDLLLRTATRSFDLKNPIDTPIHEVDEDNLMAHVRGQGLRQLTLAGLMAERMVWNPNEQVQIDFRYQNSGTQPTAAGKVIAHLQHGETEFSKAAGDLPALVPGAEHNGILTLDPSTLRENGKWLVTLEAETPEYPVIKGADRVFALEVSDKAVPRPFLRGMWLDDLAPGKNGGRRLNLNLVNLGNAPIQSSQITPLFQAAGHCGLDEVSSTRIGADLDLAALNPGERRLVSLPVPDLDIPPDRDFTVLAQLHSGTQDIRRYHKQFTARKNGSVALQYAQVVHRWIVTEAVNLLEKQGIYIPDLLLPGHDYLGKGPGPYLSIGAGDPTGLSDVVNTINVSSSGYWTDDLASQFPTDFTAVNGAHDCDETDIAFFYSSGDKWDSHFWLVDNGDDDGRGSHHSALTKIRALLFGQSAVSDTKIKYGAIDHYKAGYKKPAWWFMGHVLHLIGDLSVPTHIDDDSHGLYGDAYHGWMDHGHYNEYGNATIALSDGGYIDPYQSAAGADPVRFLAYTTAKVGRAWPWASTATGPEWGQDASRYNPQYTNYLWNVFNTMEQKNLTIPNMPARHPLSIRDLNRNEVKDFCSPTSATCLCCTECQSVEWVGPSEELRDCWDNNGHIDEDNTDPDGSLPGWGVNTNDQDLRAIAQSNINYAIRAAAGMLVYFSKETGIFARYRTVPAVNHNLLMD